MNKTRIKTNATQTAANITYYGGTIGAGLGFYHLLNNHGALAIVALIVFTLTVEGLLRTLLTEVTHTVTSRWNPAPATAAVEAATPKETEQR